MLITDKNDLSHFHGNNPTNHGRIHQHHPPPPPQPPPIIGGSKQTRKSKSYHSQQVPNSYPTPNHMENKVEDISHISKIDTQCSGIIKDKYFKRKIQQFVVIILVKSILHWVFFQKVT